MRRAGPMPDPLPRSAEPGLDGAQGGALRGEAGLRWLLLMVALVVPALIAETATRSVVGEGNLAPFATALGSQAWGLVAGIAGASILGLAGRRVPRPAAPVLAVLWLAPVAVLGMTTDLRALSGDPDLALVVAIVVAALVAVVALAGWSLRLSVRLTLLVIAGVLGGGLGAATTAALARRASGRPSAARTGRELAIVGPLVVLLPVILVAVVGALAARLLPPTAGDVFHVLVLGGPGVATDGPRVDAGQVEALRLAIVVPILAALALGSRAAEGPVTAEASHGDGALGHWGPLLIGAAVLGACVLLGTAMAESGAPLDGRGAAAQVAIATSFVAVGLHAPTRASGPWSPKLVLVVGIAMAALVMLALIAALAVSGRP